MIGVSDVFNGHLRGSRFSVRMREKVWSEKIIITQGPFHPPQLFPQCKYRGKQRLPTRNTIVKHIFKSSRTEYDVLDDDDDDYKGQETGGWTVGLYQWRTTWE